MCDRSVIFILGMGRSGTSALTRVLGLCGCTLPALLHPPTAANPTGYWEPVDAIDLNDEWLFQQGSTWFDPSLRLQEETTAAEPERQAYLGKITAFLKECSASSTLVLKEPRITAVFGTWLEAGRDLGFAIKVIIAIRDPREVIASQVALGTSPELACLLWLKYTLLAERISRGLCRVIVDYCDLLTDWRTQIYRISQALSVDLQNRDDDGINSFLTHDLRRQRNSGTFPDTLVFTWISRAYAALNQAAQGSLVDCAAMDRIYEEFRCCERVFRLAFDEFHNRYNPGRLREAKARLAHM